jgi:hypothetical protein
MPRRSKEHEILTVWYKYGGRMSLRRLTQLCWEEGVWTEEERHNFAFHAAMRQCHTALQKKDMAGLPLAGPSRQKEGKGRVWVQLSLWDYDTAEYNLAMRLCQTEQDYATIKAIRDYMEMRWGEAPLIPSWEFPEDEAEWWHDQWSDEDEDD